MKDKKKLELLIKKLQSGDIKDKEMQELQELIDKYPDYETYLSLHQQLDAFPAESVQPDEEKFRMMRQSVMQTVRQKSLQTKSNPVTDSLENLKNFFMRPEMAVAALTLIVGFLLGRFTPQTQSPGNHNLLGQIYSLATENKRLTDVKNSPYFYSNVSFEEIGEDEIAMSFDVSTHMDIIRPKDDPLVREVIAQALLNPSNTGNELKAIAYSSSIVDRKLKEALIFSAHNAPILAVRLKAMSSLMNYKNDRDVQRAFLDIFQTEQSVKMQLMALEYLEESRIDQEKLRSVLETLDKQKKTAVYIKAQDYLDENTEIR